MDACRRGLWGTGRAIAVVWRYSLLRFRGRTVWRWIRTSGCMCRWRRGSCWCGMPRRCAARSAWLLPYLRTDGKLEGVGGLPWLSEFGFQQTRGFRALKVWMALRYHGLSGYRASIERDILFAQKLAGCCGNRGECEVFEPQSFSIVCFRFAPRELRQEAEIDQMNKAMLEEIQLGGQVFLSSTMIDGRFWLRACIVNHRARLEDLETLVDVVTCSGRAASWRVNDLPE